MQTIPIVLTVSVMIVLLSPLGNLGFFDNAHGHTNVATKNYVVSVGWRNEPPIVGLQNDIVFLIKEKGAPEGEGGVTNAFESLDAKATFGGVEKDLDIGSDPTPGHYHSKIIPTRTGTIIVELKGTIRGDNVNANVPIESIEPQAQIAFPDTGGSSGQDVAKMKSALTGLQKEVGDLKSKTSNLDEQKSDQGIDPETAYNFGVFGMSIGVAGIVLAAISVIRKR